MLFNAQSLRLVRQGKHIGIPLSFHTVRGDLIWVRGSNGAGKSTLLQLLAGLLPSSMQQSYTFAEPKPSMFYLGHQLGLVPGLTAFEHCLYHPALVKPSASQILSAFESLNLVDLAHQQCGQLSRGQQQRVAMAVVLLSKATLWLLDEPFTGLDQSASQQIKAALLAHQAEGAALIVSHEDISDIATKTLDMGEEQIYVA